MSEYPLPYDKIIPALIKFQAECPPVPKDKENTFFKKADGSCSKYADIATILEITKEPRTKNGLAVTQLIRNETLETYLFHESGQFLRSEMLITNDKKSAQGFGSGLTYARRYALSAILGIAADEDDDGNGAGEPKQAEKQQGQRTNTPPAAKNPPTKSEEKNPPALTFKRKNEDGTFSWVPNIAELSTKQILWYANSCKSESHKAAASDYILNHQEEFADTAGAQNEPAS